MLYGLAGGLDCKESACSVGDLGLIPRLGRSLGERSGYPLQCSCLKNSIDRETWWATVHEVANHWTQLNDFQYYICIYTHTHTHIYVHIRYINVQTIM